MRAAVGAESTASAIIEALRADGLAVWDRFLAPAEVQALAQCARARRERGDFKEARIGTRERLERRPEIRGDSICWLSQPEFPAEKDLLDALESLREELNAQAFLGLAELELHYAWYPPGSGYARHVDQPFGRTQRRVSLVLYLNEHWRSADGGALRLFETQSERFREIEPSGGRLVLFLTESRPHEVAATRCDRLSLTGWFRARG
jgi:SM-20-related protein